MIYKHIMVAMDENDASDLALLEAVRLAEDQQSRLKIMYIVDKGIITSTSKSNNQDLLWSAYKEQGQKFLDKIKRKLESTNVIFDTHLVELTSTKQNLAEKILKEAVKCSTDIIVLGTRGRKGINRFFRGSVAESVLRIATIPVLVVRKI